MVLSSLGGLIDSNDGWNHCCHHKDAEHHLGPGKSAPSLLGVGLIVHKYSYLLVLTIFHRNELGGSSYIQGEYGTVHVPKHPAL
jgi:hypothetical protein